jgi:hypothetical protein
MQHLKIKSHSLGNPAIKNEDSVKIDLRGTELRVVDYIKIGFSEGLFLYGVPSFRQYVDVIVHTIYPVGFL